MTRVVKKTVLTGALLALVSLSPVPSAQAEVNLLAPPALINAVIKSDYDSLRSQLLKGENPNTATFDKVTALMIATKNDALDVMELLLEYEALPDLQDKIGNTALFYAADKNNYEATQILLDAGADPNKANSQGVTPFLNALTSSEPDIVQLLMDRGGDILTKDYTGRGALDWARNNRLPQVFDMMERAGATY